MFAQETLQQPPEVGAIGSHLADEETRAGAGIRSGHAMPLTLLMAWLDSFHYSKGLFSSQLCGDKQQLLLHLIALGVQPQPPSTAM